HPATTALNTLSLHDALPISDQETQLEPGSVSEWFKVPASGGLYVARRPKSTAAVIVPPAVRGFADLRCNPLISDRVRSPEKALRSEERRVGKEGKCEWA